MKKTIIAAVIAASTVTINTAWAAPESNAFGSSIVHEMKKIYYGSVLHREKEPLPKAQLQNIISLNTAQTKVDGKLLSPSEAAALNASIDTSNNLSNTLTQFFYGMYEHDSNVSDKIKTAEYEQALKNNPDSANDENSENKDLFKHYMNDNKLTALTVNKDAVAKDTLFVAREDSETRTNSKTFMDAQGEAKSRLDVPDQFNNDNLDFATLITPTAYTPTQTATAKRFLKYAAQSTQNFTEGLGLDQLYTKRTGLNVAALANLKEGVSPNSQTYLKYQLELRSLLAIRSMLINSLNQLIAERTPIKGLGTAAGVEKITYNAQGKATVTPVADASPLQVEAYQANHRIDNPQWYVHVENATPANVQRETLIVLAEIEHQNFEAQLEREKLIAATTALGLQTNSEETQNMLTLEAPKVNAAIHNLVVPPATSTPTPPKK